MKKLMTLVLGAAFVLTTVPVIFAQDAPPKKEATEKKTARKRRPRPRKTKTAK